MTDVLRTTMTDGTGKAIQLNSMISAGKTGSTNDSKDGWFAGYTPYYTTVVWAGYDTPKSVDNLYGSTYPGKAWQQYMNEIHVGLENKGFEAYASLEEEENSIAQQEEQKVLCYEVTRDIPIFVSLDLSTYDAVMYADLFYWALIDKVNRIEDETIKTDFLNQINDKKVYIDSQKPWFY